MNAIRHIRRLAGALAGLAGVLLAFGATPALAMIRVPGPGGDPSGAPPVSSAPTHTITLVTGGMPGWQITLIALGRPCSRPPSPCSWTGHEPPAGTRSPQSAEPCPQTSGAAPAHFTCENDLNRAERLCSRMP